MTKELALNLTDLANGAVQEKLNYAIVQVAENILDLNTDAKKARKVTITLSMKPNENRDTVALDTDVKTTLAPQVSVASTLLVGREKGKPVVNELKSGVKGQEYFDPEDSTLKHDTGEPVTNAPIDFRSLKTAKEAN